MRLPLHRLLIAVLALIAIGYATHRLEALSEGLHITRLQVGQMPVTVHRPETAVAAPAIVIAHGFAGSQTLMQPFATTLARNGYVAVTFDFPGHGRHPRPLGGGLADADAMQTDLLGSLQAVIDTAIALPGTDGRIALLGHSMAADVVVRQGDADPRVQATVAVSLFSPDPQAYAPRNLLIIDGALEAAMLIQQGLAVIGRGNPDRVEPGTTYGSFSDGSARRLALSRGVEHIGVLYSRDSMSESLDWLNQVFGRQGNGFLDVRGAWLGLLFLGLVLLAGPLAAALPRAADPASSPAVPWRRLVPLMVLPALLTPLLLWKLPTGFLPLLLGDYLALHFALYGLLTAVGLGLAGRNAPATPRAPVRGPALLLAACLVGAYSLLAMGLPLDRYVTSLMPGSTRGPLILALLLGTLPYFLADEWLTRRYAPRRGAYALSKLCFLLSLVLAVALNLEALFFLVIIVPAILLLFGIYGLFSAWVHRHTGHPLPAALANALVFAWFIAVSFPVVVR